MLAAVFAEAKAGSDGDVETLDVAGAGDLQGAEGKRLEGFADAVAFRSDGEDRFCRKLELVEGGFCVGGGADEGVFFLFEFLKDLKRVFKRNELDPFRAAFGDAAGRGR